MEQGATEAAFQAARAGDLEGVRRALDADPEVVRATTEHDVTLLHIAAELDDVELARLLLERGGDMEAEASWGYTPFEWAAAMASDRVARLLLDRGARGLNLWTASALGMIDRVRAAFGADGPKPGEGREPRAGADLTGWPDDAPYRTGDRVSDAFHIAARNGRRHVAELLLERGADVDAIGYFGATALHWAAIAGREEIVRWLLSVGADPLRRDPEFDATPAGWAREGGHEALADLLESWG